MSARQDFAVARIGRVTKRFNPRVPISTTWEVLPPEPVIHRSLAEAFPLDRNPRLDITPMGPYRDDPFAVVLNRIVLACIAAAAVFGFLHWILKP